MPCKPQSGYHLKGFAIIIIKVITALLITIGKKNRNHQQELHVCICFIAPGLTSLPLWCLCAPPHVICFYIWVHPVGQQCTQHLSARGVPQPNLNCSPWGRQAQVPQLLQANLILFLSPSPPPSGFTSTAVQHEQPLANFLLGPARATCEPYNRSWLHQEKGPCWFGKFSSNQQRLQTWGPILHCSLTAGREAQSR